MNCETIDSILDERRSALLPDAQRQSVAAHLAGCRRCADSWGVHDALAAEHMGRPPAELWGRATQRVRDAREARAAAGRGFSVRLGGVAAAAAAVILAARFLVVAPAPETETQDASPLPMAADRRYAELAAPASTADTLDRIEVHEFFMYLCFPCFTFEDELADFRSDLGSYVALTRVPAMFYPDSELHARAFYTAEALGKLEEMHGAFYDEIQTRGNRLASSAALAELFGRFGVDAATFERVFDSPDVEARVRRAAALNARYDISAVPTLVVAGRAATSVGATAAEKIEMAKDAVAEEAERGALRWLAQQISASPRRSPGIDEPALPVDDVEQYARLLEAAERPAAPRYVELALERARARLSAEQVAEAEGRYRARRAAR